MKACQKPVYKTMCETDKGIRHGKYRGISYESTTKKRGSTATKTKTKGTAKTVPKATAKTTKKEDMIWKSMSRKIFEDDRPDTFSMEADRSLDVLDDEDTWLLGGDVKPIKRMYRDEQLRKAYAARRTKKRTKYGTAKDPRDPSVWVPEIIQYPYIRKINAKAWTHPATGEVRYYVEVEDAAKLNGLVVERYKTGNICNAELNGKEISNSEAKRILGDVSKIWYTKNGKVNIKFYDDERIHYRGFWNGVASKIESIIQKVA